MRINYVEFASKQAAAKRDRDRRFELQVMKNGWMPLIQAGDVAVLKNLVPSLAASGRETRIFDWINAVTVQA